MDWAITQTNLDNALSRLGERESGTSMLEDAVAAYREALPIFQTAKADHYIKKVRGNLRRAEQLLDERR